MKILMKTIIAIMLVGFSLLNAGEHHDHDHGGHDHKHSNVHKHGPYKEGDSKTAIRLEENQPTIEKNAKKKIQTLVEKKKIPESWSSVPMQKIEKAKNETKDWEVSFKNLKITNKAKQTLYVFVSPYGKVVGVNYTGK